MNTRHPNYEVLQNITTGTKNNHKAKGVIMKKARIVSETTKVSIICLILSATLGGGCATDGGGYAQQPSQRIEVDVNDSAAQWDSIFRAQRESQRDFNNSVDRSMRSFRDTVNSTRNALGHVGAAPNLWQQRR